MIAYQDILGLIYDAAPFEVIGLLGRTCKYWLGRLEISRADPSRWVQTRVNDEGSRLLFNELPNGLRHGGSHMEVSHVGGLTIQYSLGRLSGWSYRTSTYTVYGRADTNLTCNVPHGWNRHCEQIIISRTYTDHHASMTAGISPNYTPYMQIERTPGSYSVIYGIPWIIIPRDVCSDIDRLFAQCEAAYMTADFALFQGSRIVYDSDLVPGAISIAGRASICTGRRLRVLCRARVD